MDYVKRGKVLEWTPTIPFLLIQIKYFRHPEI